MAELNDRIGPDQGLVGGDHFNVERTTTEVPDGRSITKAWMTAKKHEDDADDSVWQKEITDTDQAEVGHITDPGSGSGEDRSATMLFRLQPDETAAVEGGSTSSTSRPSSTTGR